MRATKLLALAVVGACAGPIDIDRASVLTEVAGRYSAFFPEGAGLLAPRFGAPAVVRAGDGFAVELLRRAGDPAPRAALLAPGLGDADAVRCLDGAEVAGCWPLALAEAEREDVDGRSAAVRIIARPLAAPPAGGYDLAVDGARAPRAVWLRAEDPDAPRPLRVIQLSDLHVGKRPAELEPHIREVIGDVNRLAPDLVVVTGDLVEDGERAGVAQRAAELLRTVDAPVLAVMAATTSA